MYTNVKTKKKKKKVKTLRMGPFSLWQIKWELVAIILLGTFLCLPVGKSDAF